MSFSLVLCAVRRLREAIVVELFSVVCGICRRVPAALENDLNVIFGGEARVKPDPSGIDLCEFCLVRI